MGGGGMRTAAAAASWAARSGLGRAGSAVGRRSTVPSASAAAAESAPISMQAGLDEAVTPAISQWEVDDWKFGGWKDEGEELVVEPAPRLVFGPPLTIQEAKEATSDLMCALEITYFSESAEVSSKKNEQGQNGLFPNNSMIAAMPRSVVQAFSLLQSSPEAQSVVASLASDKAVCDAVKKNNKLMEFYRNNQSSLTENIFEDSSKTNPTDNSDNNTSFEEASKESNRFVDFVTNMKEKAMEVVKNVSNVTNMKEKSMEVVKNVSNLIQNVFGMKSDDGAHTSETDERNSNGFTDFILTPNNAFLSLAIAVIFIVVLKRASV
ncbi:hypothetical protein LUZ60_009134 [Juncus effusus]|nr:hypothetical protein LUZ60_009134 [Juncus effusus]